MFEYLRMVPVYPWSLLRTQERSYGSCNRAPELNQLDKEQIVKGKPAVANFLVALRSLSLVAPGSLLAAGDHSVSPTRLFLYTHQNIGTKLLTHQTGQAPFVTYEG